MHAYDVDLEPGGNQTRHLVRIAVVDGVVVDVQLDVRRKTLCGRSESIVYEVSALYSGFSEDYRHPRRNRPGKVNRVARLVYDIPAVDPVAVVSGDFGDALSLQSAQIRGECRRKTGELLLSMIFLEFIVPWHIAIAPPVIERFQERFRRHVREADAVALLLWEKLPVEPDRRVAGQIDERMPVDAHSTASAPVDRPVRRRTPPMRLHRRGSASVPEFFAVFV